MYQCVPGDDDTRTTRLGASPPRSRVPHVTSTSLSLLLPSPALPPAGGGVRCRGGHCTSAPRPVMAATRLVLLAALLALLLAAAQTLAAPPGAARARRQLADDNTLQPLDDDSGDEQAREKRKLEGITQAKFGIKNAVLGFVFGKINSLIDSKTRLVENLDRQNIEINKQYGIEAPKGGGLGSLSGFVGQVIGPKLQLLGPKIQAVSSLFGASSGSSGGSGGGSGLGSILSLVTSLSGSSSGGAAAGGTVETVDSDEDDS